MINYNYEVTIDFVKKLTTRGFHLYENFSLQVAPWTTGLYSVIKAGECKCDSRTLEFSYLILFEHLQFHVVYV